MQTLGKARRVRIYTGEDDRWEGVPLHRAVVDLLRAEHAQGATVYRGVEGFGAAGELHGRSPDVVARLPVVVEWIDSPEHVDRLLPRVLELVRHGLVTVDEPELLRISPHRVRELRPTATVADVMRREVVTVEPAMPIRQVVELMLGKTYRALPVVDGGRLVGIVTNSDLVQRGGLEVRLDLLQSLERPEVQEALERLSALGRTAGEAMTRGPVTVTPETTLPEAAETMARRRLKRLPVVDPEGRLVGLVSRLDLLRAAAAGSAGAAAAAPEPCDLGLSRDEPLAKVMRRDLPVVHPGTPLPEVFQAVIATRLHRAFVVDDEGRVVGLVSDAELLERLAPALRPTALQALVRRLPFSRPREEPTRGRTAADVMSTTFARVDEGALLSDAIGRMLHEGQKVVAVTDPTGKLVGMVDRADLLRGLVLPYG